MMLKMDRSSVTLVSLLAVTSQKEVGPKMPAWSMLVAHSHIKTNTTKNTDTLFSVCENVSSQRSEVRSDLQEKFVKA